LFVHLLVLLFDITSEGETLAFGVGITPGLGCPDCHPSTVKVIATWHKAGLGCEDC
jgi:hypothetical protein